MELWNRIGFQRRRESKYIPTDDDVIVSLSGAISSHALTEGEISSLLMCVRLRSQFKHVTAYRITRKPFACVTLLHVTTGNADVRERPILFEPKRLLLMDRGCYVNESLDESLDQRAIRSPKVPKLRHSAARSCRRDGDI